MKIGIDASAYPLISVPTKWHGTERALAGLAKRLPAVFIDDLQTTWWDAAIVCERSSGLMDTRARRRIFTTSMSYFDPSGLSLADRCVFVSDHHKQHALKTYSEGLKEERCAVIPYATDAKPVAPKVPGRLLWGSSPDRGLHHALRIFKKAREKMPDLTLEVTYALKNLHAVRWEHSPNGLRMVEIESLLGQEGVIFQDHIERQDMLRAISEAEILLYPFDPIIPTEFFGLIVLECMACGTIPLLSQADCFAELWGDHAPILGWPIKDDEWIAAIEWLRDPKVGDEYRAKGYERAAQHSWKAIVKQWREVLHAS